MKFAILLAIAIVVLSSLPVFSNQNSADAQESTIMNPAHNNSTRAPIQQFSIDSMRVKGKLSTPTALSKLISAQHHEIH